VQDYLDDNDGNPAKNLTVAVAKGRDFDRQGAVDGCASTTPASTSKRAASPPRRPGRHDQRETRRAAGLPPLPSRSSMDWGAEGLLDELDDDAARRARAKLLDELHEDGVPVEELKRLVDEDKLVLAPVSRLLSSEERYTALEIAERSGVEIGMLAASWRALGLPVPGLDERVFGDHDLEAARLGALHRQAGFDDEDALEVTRVLGQGMARYAEATKALVARTFMEPGLDEYELASRYASVAQRLLPLAGPWLEHVYATHLQQVLRSDAVTQEQRRTGALGDTQDAVIAFADMVGFTELGESVPVEELGSVAGRLSRLAGEAADPPVRIVKLIGDAVMLVAPHPEPMIETALRLVELADEDDAIPPLRAGMASGEAVHRWGDWFGTPVNLASRLTTRARPSSVLVTEQIRDATSGKYDFSDAGKKKLKGFSAPIRAYRARRSP
jgi:adenylate cyclase